jgi:hypothetical protein
MSITSAQSYEMRIARSGDKIVDPPEPYWQTVAVQFGNSFAYWIAANELELLATPTRVRQRFS